MWNCRPNPREIREGRRGFGRHNLEVEDLRAMNFEASAFTGVKMAGLDRAFVWQGG